MRAPRDPAWVADGFVSEHWAPASPVTGRVDAFEWRVPVERLGQLIEQDERVSPVAVAAIEAPAKAKVDPVADIVDIEPEPAPVAPAATPVETTPLKAVAASVADAVADGEEDLPVRLPDDPGVTPEEAEQAQRRFRLF